MANVQWEFDGDPDPLVGTGATFWEQTITYAASVVGALVYIVLWVMGALPWTWWQYLVGTLIAADIAGGVVANATNSCKRFYHTPARDDDPGWLILIKTSIVFDALHIYPIIVAAVFYDIPLTNGIFWYVLLMVSVIIVRLVPLYLRRPVAMTLIALAVILNLYVLPLSPPWVWLMPLLFLKIVYGHSVREEPYRPESEQNRP